MKLVIGLGNPGEEYRNNRHNVGYMFIDQANKQIKNKGILFLKTNSFMNSSGEAVVKLTRQHSTKPNDLYIVHDDLDIPLGSYKIQFGVGPKVHNGINNIEHELGTSEFWRVRIGVDNRPVDGRTKGEEYVLLDFADEERKKVDEVIKKSLKELNEKLQ